VKATKTTKAPATGKRGRPPFGDVKTVQLSMKVAPLEAEQIKEAAAADMRSVADFMRIAVLKHIKVL